MNNRTLSRYWLYGFFFFVMCIVLIIAMEIVKITFTNSDYITGMIPFETIANTLDISVPSNYSGFSSEGTITRRGNILLGFRMEFVAQATSIAPILERICNGVAYKNYDPFDAFNVDQNINYPAKVLISLGNIGYISYSPLLLERNTSGNACVHGEKGNIAFSLEELAQQERKLRVHYSSTCCIGAIDVKPKTNVPFLLRNVVSTFGIIRIDSHQQICIDLDPAALYSDPNFSEQILGANVEVMVDNNLWPYAYVSEEGLTLENSEPMTDPKQLNQNYNYCYRPVLSVGDHEMKIKVETQNKKNFEYSWVFNTKLGEKE